MKNQATAGLQETFVALNEEGHPEESIKVVRSILTTTACRYPSGPNIDSND